MALQRKVYHSFSDSLLRTSKYFTKLSFKIESENEKASEEIKENNKSYVIGAVISSVAFLESTISELFWSATKNPTGITRALNEDLRNRIAIALNDFINTYKCM